MATTVDSVKMELMKEDLKNLLHEFSNSYEVDLEFKFNDCLGISSQGKTKVFDVTMTAFTRPEYEGSQNVRSRVTERAGQNAVYESNWRRGATRLHHDKGLDLSIFGKVLEIWSARQGRKCRYRVLGLNSLNRGKKYCIAMLDIDSGKTWGCDVNFVKSGKVIE